MQTLYYPITVDILESHLPPVIAVKQNDTARGVAVTLTASGEPYDIPQHAAIMLRVRRPNKQPAVMQATLRSNIIYADFSTAALETAGNAVADVAIYDTDSKLVSSFLFFLQITGAAVESTEITASPDYDALAKLLADVMRTEAERAAAEAARVEAEASRVSAESARVTAEAARASAETSRANTEADRVTAEAARAAAESTRQGNESTRQSQEATRQQAEAQRATDEATRSSQEASRVSAESARVSAESARVTAEAARASAETSRANTEADRVTAEAARAAAESTRQGNESTRQSQETARQQAESARAEEYAAFMATYGEALRLLETAAADAEAVKNIYSKMQITLFFDEDGGICYTENETT